MEDRLLMKKKIILIKKPIPVTKLYKGKGIYSCPSCGGTLLIKNSKKCGKTRIFYCPKCRLEGNIIGSSFFFSSTKSNKMQSQNQIQQTGSQTSKQKQTSKRLSESKSTKSMTDQEYYKYLVKHKGNSTRLLSRGEHVKIMNKHKKPSGIGSKTYHKPKSIKLWS